jgi:hypothetical protein
MEIQDSQARSKAIKSILAPDHRDGYVNWRSVTVSMPFQILILSLSCLLILTNVVLATSFNLVNGFTGQFSLGHAGFMAVGAYTSAWLVTRPELAAIPDYLRFLTSANCCRTFSCRCGIHRRPCLR